MNVIYYNISCTEPAHFADALPNLFDMCTQQQAQQLCLCSVRERVDTEQLTQQLCVLADYLNHHDLPVKQLRLIVNNTISLDQITHQHLFSRVDALDYFLCFTLYNTLHQGQPVNTSWNIHTQRALYLMGKPYSHHRLGVFYQFTQQPEFLQTLNYSYDPYTQYLSDPAPDRFTQTKALYQQYDPEGDYTEFGHKYQRFLDVFDPGDQLHKLTTGAPYEGFTGFPFDPDFYAHTLFSIVSETDHGEFGDPVADNWITEKTWRAVINRHPFVLFDLHGHKHQYLKSLGLHTFEHYYTHSFQDLQQHTDHRIHAQMYAENCVNFASRILADKTQVSDQIQHNAELIINLANRYISDLFDGNQEDFWQFLAHTGAPYWKPA